MIVPTGGRTPRCGLAAARRGGAGGTGTADGEEGQHDDGQSRAQHERKEGRRINHRDWYTGGR